MADVLARPATDDPGTRGRLVVDDRAVARIAAAAAAEVEGVAPRPDGRAGLAGLADSVADTVTSSARNRPNVKVTVAGTRVRAAVEVVGRWPLPAARVAADVRDRVARALHDYADLSVDAVDVTVTDVVRVGPNSGPRNSGTARRTR